MCARPTPAVGMALPPRATPTRSVCGTRRGTGAPWRVRPFRTRTIASDTPPAFGRGTRGSAAQCARTRTLMKPRATRTGRAHGARRRRRASPRARATNPEDARPTHRSVTCGLSSARPVAKPSRKRPAGLAGPTAVGIRRRAGASTSAPSSATTGPSATRIPIAAGILPTAATCCLSRKRRVTREQLAPSHHGLFPAKVAVTSGRVAWLTTSTKLSHSKLSPLSF